MLSKLPHSENGTIYIELPIIGSVVNHTQMFSAIDLQPEERINSSDPMPLYMMNLSAGMKDGESPASYK